MSVSVETGGCLLCVESYYDVIIPSPFVRYASPAVALCSMPTNFLNGEVPQTIGTLTHPVQLWREVGHGLCGGDAEGPGGEAMQRDRAGSAEKKCALLPALSGKSALYQGWDLENLMKKYIGVRAKKRKFRFVQRSVSLAKR